MFEWVYFARPDSTIDGRSVYRARERMGRRLAIEHGVPADVVVPVPDSGVAAAIGYARESGIPYDQGLMRSHYMGRTFIEPSQQIRHFGVKLKLSPVREVLTGKRVVVVDDSIVRGTTSRKIVGMIRGAGAREVHLRISSPPTVGPCRYGIDTPIREELIASTHTPEEIRKYRRRRFARLPVARRALRVGEWSARECAWKERLTATPASPTTTRSTSSSRPACGSSGSSPRRRLGRDAWRRSPFGRADHRAVARRSGARRPRRGAAPPVSARHRRSLPGALAVGRCARADRAGRCRRGGRPPRRRRLGLVRLRAARRSGAHHHRGAHQRSGRDGRCTSPTTARA